MQKAGTTSPARFWPRSSSSRRARKANKLTKEQQRFRDQFTSALGVGGAPFAEPTRAAFQSLEEQARKNMAVFRQALTMFNPFGVPAEGMMTTAPSLDEQENGGVRKEGGDDVADLKRQLDELNKRIDNLSKG
ncbi:MAG: polyhydroxyalkonate synthesis repressor [Methylocystaceae bacterium]|nr:MAG: polyhydroxyalkonate synthesis repressor [Methylocystaceae bacterium]